MKIECNNPLEVAKTFFWLAWQACSREFGMGVFQARPQATKEEVWNRLYNRGDYPGGNTLPGSMNTPNDIYADYVFGRMMKVGIKLGADYIEISNSPVSLDYQAWSRVYKSTQELALAAIKETI